MNRINPSKLKLSKWTATQPTNREKHFIVTEVVLDSDENITHCILQAVHSNREFQLDWKELRDKLNWLQGWV